MSQFTRLRVVVAVVLLAAAALSGCATTTTKTVTTSTGAASTNTTPANTASAPQSPQVFHGSGQQDLGTIVVPTDSTISWNCPSCSNTNFIVNNAHSDDNAIKTNALDQTQGVDPIAAGTYHTVVVDTSGGPWTIAIGATAPSPDSGATSSSSGTQSRAGYTQCDPNISAKTSATDCQFAQNTFYEYWAHHGASTISVYSPTTGTSFTTHCGSSSGQVDCITDQGGDVQFSQSSIDAYTSSQAASYAATHSIAP